MRHLFYSFAGTGAVQLLNLASGVLAARLLLPEGRGELAAVVLWPSVIAAIGCFSIDQAIVYHAARRPESAPRLLALGLYLTALCALVTVAVAFPLLPRLYGGFSPEVGSLARLYLLVSVPTFGFALVATGFLQGTLRFGEWNLVRTLQPLAYVGGILLLLAYGMANLRGFALAALAGGVVSLALGLWFCFRAAARQERSGSATTWRQVMGYSSTVHLGSLMSMLAARLDMMLISLILAATELGLYAVATALASPIGLISSTLVPLIFAKVSGQQAEAGQRLVLGRYLRLGLAMTLSAALCLAVLGPWLLELLFGRAFLPAVEVFRVLLLALVLGGIGTTLATGLKAGGHPEAVNKVQLATLLLSALVMPALILGLGLIGAAWGLVLVNTAAALYTVILVMRLFHADPRALILPSRADWRFAKEQLAGLLRAPD